MKIYFNRKPVVGPWGGGSKVLHAIIDAFIADGNDVVFTYDDSCDVLFCMDPRPSSDATQLHYYALKQASQSSRKKLLVQRVGDVGTHSKPDLTEFVKKSVPMSDVVIFPSKWALDFMDVHIKNANIIKNAPVKQFFSFKNVKNKLTNDLVTHHWSTNDLKGFLFYNSVAKSKKYRFTYIGRVPPLMTFDSLGVFDVDRLSMEIPRHSVYVSASMFEAGANHVLEAVACGLPVIYHKNGGSIPEYCELFGIPFDGTIDSFNAAYDELNDKYDDIKKNISTYKESLNDVAIKYVELVKRYV